MTQYVYKGGQSFVEMGYLNPFLFISNVGFTKFGGFFSLYDVMFNFASFFLISWCRSVIQCGKKWMLQICSSLTQISTET